MTAAEIKRPRDLSIDFIRVIACLMVVMIHTAAYDFDYADPASSQWMAQNVYDCFVRSGVPLFFMLSGIVYLQKEEITVSYIWKKILRLLIVYILFYVIYKAFEVRHELMRDPLYLLEALRWGHFPHFHLWFMPELAAIYIMLPFIHHCAHTKPELAKYYLLVFFIFSVIKTTVLKIPGFPEPAAQYIHVFTRVQLIDYAGYFVLGWYLNEKIRQNSSRNETVQYPARDCTLRLSIEPEGTVPSEQLPRNKKTALCMAAVFLSSVLIMAVLTRSVSMRSGKPDIRWYDNFTIFTFCEAVSLFCLLKFAYARGAGFFEKPRTGKVLSLISSCSFFIYLIHPLVIDLVAHFKLTPVRYNLWISIPLFTLLYWFISLVVALVVRKIPGLRSLF